ncbi:unnamed protein product [Macrosiphum euphorbiae]|uniref:Uncharacterized protein n=1 Tax=Macrosiphum euphorbiae TaxID=13131 RepID=A0AAV0WH72_9HEMI|nr:unnamed protein product [Macrosiphum euphorbiae]
MNGDKRASGRQETALPEDNSRNKDFKNTPCEHLITAGNASLYSWYERKLVSTGTLRHNLIRRCKRIITLNIRFRDEKRENHSIGSPVVSTTQDTGPVTSGNWSEGIKLTSDDQLSPNWWRKVGPFQ